MQKSILRNMICLSGAGLLIGAAANSSHAGATSNVATGLQVAVGDCAFASPLDAGKKSRVLDTLAGIAISKGVNKIASAVAAAGTAKSWTISGSRNFQAKEGEFPRCVQIVRGRFRTDTTTASDPHAWSKTSPWTDEAYTTLVKNGLVMADEPDFFLEGEFVSSKDKQALTVRPVKAWMNRPAGTRFFRPGSDRSIAVFLAIHDPTVRPDLATNPAATVVLGPMSKATPLSYAQDWPDAVSSPYEATWFQLRKSDTLAPLTISVLVTETQSANEFMAFMGDVLTYDTAKSTITTAIQQAVIPSVGSAAAQSDAEVKLQLQVTADEKFALAIEATRACAVAKTSIVTTAASAHKALLESLSAESKTVSPRPIVTLPLVQGIDLSKPSTLTANCTNIYGLLTGGEQPS
jgi:hypothetical protein